VVWTVELSTVAPHAVITVRTAMTERIFFMPGSGANPKPLAAPTIIDMVLSRRSLLGGT
jgi:hypothetical protein